MQRHAKLRSTLAQMALTLVSVGLLFAVASPTIAAPEGSFPPTLSYNPASGSTITLTGVGAVGSPGSAQITVTPSGGSGSGTFATVGLNCSVTGNEAAFFTVSPSSQSFTPTSPPAQLALSCTSGASPRNAILGCNETPGGSSGAFRSWPVVCPAGTAATPPSLSFAPPTGSTINFQPASAIVGSTATAQIRVTPGGGAGSGGLATTKLDSCSLSSESVPGTFAGFQTVSLTFIGSSTAQQNINLTALVRPVAVTATLTCNETRGISGGLTSPDGNVFQRSWQLQSGAGIQPSRLTLSKSVSAAQVLTDSEFSYTIDVGNAGSSTETGLIVLDDVPSALTVLSAAGAGWNCSINGNAVDCRRSSLTQNSSASFDILVRAPSTPRNVSNTARLTSQGASSSVVASVSVEVVARPPNVVDLRLDKRDSVDPVLSGASFSYLLEVSNLSDQTANGVRVSDALPAGLSLISAGGPGWTCSGSSSINCTLSGTLAAGASSTIVVQVSAPTQAGTINNTATVTSDDGDSNSANNTDSESTVILSEPPPPPIPQADLGISAVAVPATARTGEAVELQVSTTNRGPDAATATTVTGTLSAAFDLRSATGTGWTCSVSGQQLQCTRAGLAANGGADIRVQTVIRAGATAIAEANFVIASAIADPVPGNNSARVVVSYQSGGADLAIVKTDSVDPVVAAAQYSYTLTISNGGPEAASGVRVSDVLPAALTFVSASGAGFTCANVSGTVNCDLTGSLAAGASASVLINVRAPTSGQTINNEGTVASTTADRNLTNNRSTQSTRINDRSAADLSQLLDDAAIDPPSRAALPVVAAECANPASALADACREIIRAADAGRDGEVTEALRAIAPDEVLAQTLVLREISATQFFNVDARLNELRRGGGGFSLSGLTVNSGNQSIPLALVGDALQAALGFDAVGGDLVSPWGVFINGNIGSGSQDVGYDTGRVGADYDSRGITAGVDYRLSSRAVVGGAIGYANFTSDINGGSELDAKSLLFTGYGSYYVNDRFYIDSRLSYGNVSLEQQRQIRFQLGSTLFDALATGESDASQFTVASSIGYHLNYGAWSVTPNAGLRYAQSDVDAFDESGADEYNVRYDSQSISSVQFAVGVQVARAVSLRNGVLMPSFDLSLNNESGDDPQAEARLLNGSVAELFRLEEVSPDSSYGTAGLGFVYLLGNGRQAFVSYRHTFGSDSFDRGTLNLGGRFEF